MEQLLQATTAALTADEAATRDVHQRTELADALRLLREHAPTLVKAYPMALLEVFAEGPAPAKSMPATATGMDFGELSLMDDAQVQARVIEATPGPATRWNSSATRSIPRSTIAPAGCPWGPPGS